MIALIALIDLIDLIDVIDVTPLLIDLIDASATDPVADTQRFESARDGNFAPPHDLGVG